MLLRLILCFLFIPYVAFAQVEALDSKEAIEQFIKEKFDYQEFSLGDSTWYSSDEQKRKADSIGVDYWAKVDLDHDEVLDLFTMAYGKTKENDDFADILIFLAKRNKVKRLKVNSYFFRFAFGPVPLFPKVISIKGKNYLELTYFLPEDNCETHLPKTIRKVDTIYVKNDFIIPFSVKPSDLEFKSINLKTSACLGTCPIFELFIKYDQTAIYDGYKYTKRKGNYRLRAEQKDVDFITSLIKCLDTKKLKNSYSICWTDFPTATINIRYLDGSTKTIVDYGQLGTYKLTLLYDYLFDLADF